MPLSLPFSIVPLIVCTVVGMVMGMLWFSPLMFAETWMRHTGITKQKMKKGPPPTTYVVSLMTGFLMALALSTVFHLLGIRDAAAAVAVALILWLGLYAFPLLNHYMYDGRSKQLYLIHAGYDLTNLVVMSLILQAWR